MNDSIALQAKRLEKGTYFIAFRKRRILHALLQLSTLKTN